MAQKFSPRLYGTNAVTMPPDRSYQLPGGPFSDRLPPPTVTKRADIVRGSDEDRGAGGKR